MTRKAFENAITVDMAIGGSTNAVVHLLAIAGRLGIDLQLDDFDAISRRTPYIANVKPSGEYLMEDFFYAGGLPVVMKEILPLLHGDAMTVTGKSHSRECRDAPMPSPRSDPHRRTSRCTPKGGTVVLYGNLAPDGAVIKQTAASPHLLQHRGKAYVFENYEQMRAQIDSMDLPVHQGHRAGDEELRTEGRAGIPGMGSHSHAEGAAGAGHPRHGAHQRCAHERHQLRNGRAARRAGIGDGRTAGDRANRR